MVSRRRFMIVYSERGKRVSEGKRRSINQEKQDFSNQSRNGGSIGCVDEAFAQPMSPGFRRAARRRQLSGPPGRFLRKSGGVLPGTPGARGGGRRGSPASPPA